MIQNNLQIQRKTISTIPKRVFWICPKWKPFCTWSFCIKYPVCQSDCAVHHISFIEGVCVLLLQLRRCGLVGFYGSRWQPLYLILAWIEFKAFKFRGYALRNPTYFFREGWWSIGPWFSTEFNTSKSTRDPLTGFLTLHLFSFIRQGHHPILKLMVWPHKGP